MHEVPVGCGLSTRNKKWGMMWPNFDGHSEFSEFRKFQCLCEHKGGNLRFNEPPLGWTQLPPRRAVKSSTALQRRPVQPGAAPAGHTRHHLRCLLVFRRILIDRWTDAWWEGEFIIRTLVNEQKLKIGRKYLTSAQIVGLISFIINY